MRFALAAAFLILTLAACSGNIPADDGVPFERIEQGAGGTGFEEETYEAIRSEDRWLAAWDTLHSGTIPPPQAPAIDFDERTVLLAASGVQPTTGHSIEITDVQDVGTATIVTVSKTAPAPGSLTGQALTYPYDLVTIPATDERISFEVE